MPLSRLFIVFILGVVCFFWAAGSVRAASPEQAGRMQASFDCAKAAAKVEKLVCASPAVAAQDREVAGLFKLAQGSKAAVGDGASGVLEGQRAWLKDRNSCANIKQAASATDCLASSYKERISALSVQVLFMAPQAALASLQKINPDARNLYEAVMLYAQGAAKSGQKARLLALMNGFGPLESPMVSDTDSKVPPYESYLKSDADFARFFNIVAMMTFNDVEDVAIEWPCDAMVRRPGLAAGLGAYFGSSLDNFMPRSNCGERQPMPAVVESYISSVNNKMSACDGTMRFATYRSMAKRASDMRLNIIADTPESDVAKVIAKSRLPYTPALAALTAYYQVTFRLDAAKAAVRAREGLQLYAGSLAGDACG
jgi:uncharacterized protein